MTERFLLLMVSCCLLTEATPADVLIDRDNTPFAGVFGFPDSREGSQLESPGDDSWEFYSAVSSHSTRDTDGAESTLLDGETTRLAVTYRRGISKRMELGLEIPWVFHESGSLDALIDRWHGIFGLSQAIRDELPRDQLQFVYEDNGRIFNMNRNAHGWGDLRFLVGWQLSESANGSSALRASLKLPTGDSDRMLGSGNADFSLGLAGDTVRLMGIERLSGFYRSSAIWLGSPDLFSDRSKRVVGQLSAGLGYDVTARTAIGLQALLRSPVYDTDVSPLGDTAASVTIGLRFRLSQKYLLSLAVGEEIQAGSVPDVTFVLSLQGR
ncbi:MAG TPA: DUF3187 family protein [Woeseiaceae bacterium]